MHVRNEVILGACLITAEIPSNPMGLRSWCTKCRKQNRGLVIWSVYRRGSTCYSLNSSVHCPHSAIERAKNVKRLVYELHNIAYELRLEPPITSNVYHPTLENIIRREHSNTPGKQQIKTSFQLLQLARLRRLS